MTSLSVVIITLNEERNIQRCLESLEGVASEIVVVDSGSSDRTREICRRAGARVVERSFEGYGKQKQFAVSQAAHDWVLSIDADEVVSGPLRDELKGLFESKDGDRSAALSGDISGFKIPIVLNYMGRTMKFSGVGKKFHLRLFDRRKGNFSPATVHEGIEVSGRVGRLSGKVVHYSYADIRHHLEKINRYTTLAAEENTKKKRAYSPWWVFVKFPVTFFTYYVIRLGFLDGYPGFMWSFLSAVYAMLKVAKTIEMKEKQK